MFYGLAKDLWKAARDQSFINKFKVDCGIIHGCDLKFNRIIRNVSDYYRSIFSGLDLQDSELISSDLINID